MPRDEGLVRVTPGLLIWCVVLAFLGLNAALVGWLVIRFTFGPWWALVVFNAVLIATIYHIYSLAVLTLP